MADNTIVPDVDDAAIADLFANTKKKKKKKSKKSSKSSKEAAPAPAETTEQPAGEGANTTADADAVSTEDYDWMLGRIYGILHMQNPELIERKRFKIKPPQVLRVGTTKTCWANFTEICKMMSRPPEHLLQFVLAELGTTGSIDGNQRLLIRGKYVPKYVESLLRKYIGEYVTCKMCKSLNTRLSRDSASRLHYVTCSNCNSRRTVNPIKSGFHAVGRGERRRARRK